MPRRIEFWVCTIRTSHCQSNSFVWVKDLLVSPKITIYLKNVLRLVALADLEYDIITVRLGSATTGQFGEAHDTGGDKTTSWRKQVWSFKGQDKLKFIKVLWFLARTLFGVSLVWWQLGKVPPIPQEQNKMCSYAVYFSFKICF